MFVCSDCGSEMYATLPEPRRLEADANSATPAAAIALGDDGYKIPVLSNVVSLPPHVRTYHEKITGI